MKKEHVYLCACVLFCTLSACAIAITAKHVMSTNHPVARINFGEHVSYETPVESTYEAARLFYKLEYDMGQADRDEYKAQEEIMKAQSGNE